MGINDATSMPTPITRSTRPAVPYLTAYTKKNPAEPRKPLPTYDTGGQTRHAPGCRARLNPKAQVYAELGAWRKHLEAVEEEAMRGEEYDPYKAY